MSQHHPGIDASEPIDLEGTSGFRQTAIPEPPQITAPPRHEQRTLRWQQVAQAGVFAAAVVIVLVGLVAGSLGLAVSLFDPSPGQVTATTVSAALLVLTVGLGLALAWQALQAMLGRPSSPFSPRRAWIWILLFLLAVLGGQMVLSLGLLPALLLPPFHLAAAILPALFILWAVGRSLSGAARWREIVLQLSSGAFVSTILAFSLEMMVIVALLILLVAGAAVQPDGLEQMQFLAEHFQDTTWIQDPTLLAPLALSPVVVLVALLFFALVIPLVEESVKTVGVALLSYQRPSLAQTYLWGLACGIGFAIAEGLFNSAGGLDVWAFVVSLRVGATILHAFTGALMGMAWYYALIERRWFLGLGLFGASVGVHGLWNALAAGVTLFSLASLDAETASALPGGATLGMAAIMGLLVVLAVAVALALAGLTRWVRYHSPEFAPPRAQAAREIQPALPLEK